MPSLARNIREASPLDAPAIARVHVDSWRTTYKGLVPDAFLAALRYEDRERMWRGAIGQADRPVFVAESERSIVGFVSGGPSRDDAGWELYAVYLLQEFQGKGLGRELFGTFVRRLEEAGAIRMSL